MSDIIQRTVTQITEAEIEKHKAVIKEKVKASISSFLKSKELETLVKQTIENQIEDWIQEDFSFNEYYSKKEIKRLVNKIIK